MAIDRQIIAELSSILNIRNNLTANGLTRDSLISTFLGIRINGQLRIMYSFSVSLLLLELCFMIPKAIRSQGSFQYDSYPSHVYLWFELSLLFGKLYIQI